MNVLEGLHLRLEQLTQGPEYSRCLSNVVRINDTHEYFITYLCVKFLKVEVGKNSERIRA